MTLALAAESLEALPVFTKSLLQAGATRLTRAQVMAVLGDLIVLPRHQRRFVISGLPEPAVKALAEEWWWQAHGGQEEPAAAPNGKPWRVWSIVAARGFGKTRAGAEWVWARAREGIDGDGRPIRIALVAASLDEVERVMVKGVSGLLAVARCDEAPRWIASDGVLHFPSGAEAHAFTAERPEKLRGPQHHYAWCDELAKWPHAEATWDNLMLGLRLGERPRTLVTTTPKPIPLLKRILALPSCAQTHGRTDENPHLPADYRAAMEAMYGGTRLGRQELEGLLLEEFEGALWTREMLEKARFLPPHAAHGEGDQVKPGGGVIAADPMDSGEKLGPHGSVPPTPTGGPPPHLAMGRTMRRVVIGLDPPASTGGDSCGILVCASDENGIAYVLADLSAAGLSPEAWARRVADAAALYGATRVVAEKNQGGDMIASVLRAVDAALPVRLVQATRSKAARAEPIALRFETGRARLAGHFPELEDQLCALTWSGYQGAGSPDRADAMVWAMTELFEKQKAEPRIRLL
jgi:phage terminase large subunit-like protein